MSNKFIDDVGFFHAKFGLDCEEPASPAVPSDDLLGFRLNFLLEELIEMASANDFILELDAKGDISFKKVDTEIIEPMPDNKKLADTLDAMVDSLYVLMGTARFFGFHTKSPYGERFEEAWNRVQQANMRKVRVSNPDNSKRKSGFDVVKPEGWVPPNLDDLV